MSDSDKRERELVELLDYWRTFPAPSNEVKAVDIIDGLRRELADAAEELRAVLNGTASSAPLCRTPQRARRSGQGLR